MENLSHSSTDLEEVKVEFQAWRSQQKIGHKLFLNYFGIKLLLYLRLTL